jgi:hypothetical protein
VEPDPVPRLLAVDLGLRTGFALYSGAGRLLRYGSRHFGSTAQLRRAAASMLDGTPDVAVIAIEGGGDVAVPWLREADRRGLRTIQVHAEAWRSRLLLPRDRRSGERAKRQAGAVARRIIERSGARRPTSLRHDAAEAILVGFWAVVELGWTPSVPQDLVR